MLFRSKPSPINDSNTKLKKSTTASQTYIPPKDSFSASSSSSLSSSFSPSSSNLHLNLTFLPDYTLDLAIRSQLGSRSRLQDVPKIAQLVEQRLLAWFEERCVGPRGGWRVGVPRLWDSRAGSGGGNGGGGGESRGDG